MCSYVWLASEAWTDAMAAMAAISEIFICFFFKLLIIKTSKCFAFKPYILLIRYGLISFTYQIWFDYFYLITEQVFIK